MRFAIRQIACIQIACITQAYSSILLRNDLVSARGLDGISQNYR